MILRIGAVSSLQGKRSRVSPHQIELSRIITLPGCEGGFTLVEVILVMIVLTVLAALSLPNFSNSFTRLQLQNATQDFASIMRYAQSRAITQNARLRLVFGDQYQDYWLVQENQVENSSDEAYDGPENEIDYQRFAGRWGRKFVFPERLSVESTSSYMEFLPDGQMSKDQIKLCRGDDCYLVSTLEQRGYIHVRKL